MRTSARPPSLRPAPRSWLPPLTAYLLLLTSPAVAQMQSDWQAKWANAREYTLAVADAMPEEAYGFAPVPGAMMTFGEQLLHLARNVEWVSASKLHEGSPPARPTAAPTDKAAVRTVLAKAFDRGATALGALGYGDLDEGVEWFSGERLTKRRVGLLLFDHVTHHRAQAIVYLRLRGVTPPAYVGW